jgi:hypothetical protein
MRRWLWSFMIATAAAGPAAAATVAVTITGLAETSYELDVSGIRKSGRLAAAPGPATVRDLIDVGGLPSVNAGLTFVGAGGTIAVCPEVRVRLEAARALCEPAFVLSGRRAGTDGYVCEARCVARRAVEQDESDEEEWVYALRGRAQPLVDGWGSSQSFYTGAIPGSGAGRLYSPD